VNEVRDKGFFNKRLWHHRSLPASVKTPGQPLVGISLLNEGLSSSGDPPSATRTSDTRPSRPSCRHSRESGNPGKVVGAFN
jgi:hypothetical protein